MNLKRLKSWDLRVNSKFLILESNLILKPVFEPDFKTNFKPDIRLRDKYQNYIKAKLIYWNDISLYGEGKSGNKAIPW